MAVLNLSVGNKRRFLSNKSALIERYKSTDARAPLRLHRPIGQGCLKVDILL